MRCRFVEVSGTQLYVRQWGEGEAAVVYWDGLGGSGLHANEIAPILSDRYGLRVIAPDPPGHGRSAALPLASYRPSVLAELAAGLLDGLDVALAGFVGFSWGAQIACSFGARFPERTFGLVLIDGGYFEWRDVPGVDFGASLTGCIADAGRESDAAPFASWDAYFAAERQALRRWTPALEEAHRAMRREEDGNVVPIAGPDVEGAVRYWGYREPVTETYPLLAEKGVPVLLLTAPAGADYRSAARAAVQRFRAALPRAVVRSVPGGHDLVSDAGPEVAEIAGRWLTASSTG